MCSLFFLRDSYMGLFSSKKKTKVATATQRVIEDPMVPDSAKQSVLGLVFAKHKDPSLTEELLNNFNESLAIKVGRMYEYAKDHYPYGLPTANLGSATQGQEVVQATIEDELGTTILVDYMHYAPINSIHAGWKALVEEHGYNHLTNELTLLSAINGAPTYLKDMVAIYTQETYDEAEETSLAIWPPAANSGYTPDRKAQKNNYLSAVVKPSLPILDASATQDYVEVTYVYQNYLTSGGAPSSTLQTHTATFSIPLSSYDEEQMFYQVRYRYRDEEDEERLGIWIYEDGSGEYPDIDEIHTKEYTPLGSYYPFVHFRDDKRNLGAPEYRDTQEYITSKKCTEYLGMDYQKVNDTIHENPDIGDVESALMVMAISAETDSDVGKRYLFDYFSSLLYATADGEGISYSPLVTRVAGETAAGKTAILIRDREFAMTLQYARIRKRRRAGQIAAIGKHASFNSVIETAIELHERGVETQEIKPILRRNNVNSVTLQRQITASVYEEIQIVGLKLTYHIWKSKDFTAGFGADEQMLIPLDHSVVKQYSMADREEIYAKSLHFVFNSRVTTKVKWYQSGIFKAILVVVAIVILVFTFDPTALMVVLTTQSAAYIAVYIITQIVTALAIQAAFNWVVRKIGGELGAILAAVAFVTAMVLGYQNGSLKGAPWAEELLAVSNGLSKGVQVETQRLITETQSEYAEFDLYADEMSKELERANKLLGTNGLLDPFEFVGLSPITVFGETPDEYFDRTVHAGNIGVQAIDAITDYTEMALTLPKLRDTTVGEIYGTSYEWS